METEAKLSIPSLRVRDRVLQLTTLPGYRLGDPVQRYTTDLYFDTCDFRLFQSGIALRERKYQGRDGFTIGVKGIENTSDHLHRRVEIEQHQTTGLDLPIDPESAVGRCVLPLLSGSSLQLLFAVSQHRIVRGISEDGRLLAEASVDTVTLTGDSGSREFYELEIEANEESAEASVQALSRRYADAFGLQSQRRTKFEQAVEFFETALPGRARAENRRPGTPADGGVILFHPEDRLLDAVQALVVQQLHVVSDQGRQLLALVGGQDTGESVEAAVHDMRVAAQRCRALSALVPRRSFEGLERFLKEVRSRLAPARDAHVFPRTLHKAVQPLDSELDWLDVDSAAARREYSEACTRWAAQRDERERTLVAYLESRQYQDAVAYFLTKKATALRKGDGQRQLRDALAPIMIERFAEVDACRRSTATGHRSELHALRRKLKRVRYVCEAFASLAGAPGVEAAGAATRVQSELGTVQDATVAAATLAEYGYPATALAPLLHRLAERAEDSAIEPWIAFSQPSTREDLYRQLLRI